MDQSKELIELFECENQFQILKKIFEITNDFNPDLLVGLNEEYNIYLSKKLSHNADIELNEEFECEVLNRLYFLNKNKKYKRIDVTWKTYFKEYEDFDYLYISSYFFRDKLYDLLDSKIEETEAEAEPEPIDLSESTATEKIIYLHELGIIDFLRKKDPFNSSINRLASVLSAITGEKHGTIQSMINPMISTGVDQRKNPLNSMKAKSKVIQNLIRIGLNLNKNF